MYVVLVEIYISKRRKTEDMTNMNEAFPLGKCVRNDIQFVPGQTQIDRFAFKTLHKLVRGCFLYVHLF